MALDVYTAEDIRRHLMSSVIMALSVYYANGGRNTEHIIGILAHAHAMAAGFGLDWPSIVASCKVALGADVAGLLDAALKTSALEGGTG